MFSVKLPFLHDHCQDNIFFTLEQGIYMIWLLYYSNQNVRQHECVCVYIYIGVCLGYKEYIVYMSRMVCIIRLFFLYRKSIGYIIYNL